MHCPSCNFENPEGFAFCGKCGSSISAHSDQPDNPRDEADRRHLTVLFCDLVDSTALSTRLDPEELRDILRDYQKVCGAVIDRYDGHVAQYLGDGLLVYFGYPIAHEDDALRGVLAGLEIIDAIHSITGRIRQQYDANLAVRIGIHSGVVVAGSMGTDSRSEHLALGQVPNVAARFQGLAKPNTVIVSTETARLVGRAVIFESLGSFDLKGVDHAVEALRALRQAPGPMRFDSAGNFLTTALPNSGRARELERLSDRLLGTRNGASPNILVVGEPGVGKSHLIHSLKASQDASEQNWQIWQCSPFHVSSALYPLVVPIAELLGVDLAGDAPISLDQLRAAVSGFDLDPDEAVPSLAQVFSIPLDESYAPQHSSPQKLKDRTFGVLTELLLRYAAVKPLVLLVEDFHWVDPSTLELLSTLSKRGPGTNLILLMTMRHGCEPAEFDDTLFERVELHRLGHADAIRLIDSAAGRDLPDQLVGRILEHADGVPLFLVELTRMLMSQGELSEDPEAIRIPATLHGLLSSRLDRLGGGKKLAQIAAVIGRQFGPDLLQAVLGSDNDLEKHLETLIDEELLVREGERLVFRHVLIQDAAYDSMLRKRRRKIHKRVAQALEEKFPNAVALQPELVAHHYSEAGLPAQAMPFWQAAAQRALAGSSNLEAIDHLERALKLVPRLDVSSRGAIELDVRIKMGQALTGVRGYAAPELETHFARALELAEVMPDSPERYWSMIGLGLYHMLRAELDASLRIIADCLRLANLLQAATLQFLAEQLLGILLYYKGDFARSRQHLENALDFDTPDREYPLISPTGEDPLIPTLSFLAWCRWHEGDEQAAIKLWQRAFAIAESKEFPYGVMYAASCGAMLFQYCRRSEDVMRSAEQMSKICEEHGFFVRPLGDIMLGWARSQGGDQSSQHQFMIDGLESYRMSGAQLIQPYYLSLIADVAKRDGAVEKGIELVEQALQYSAETGEVFWMAELRRQRGEMALAQGQISLARECFTGALRMARDQGSKALELRCAVSLASLPERANGGLDTAKALAKALDGIPTSITTDEVTNARNLARELSAN